MTAVRDAASGGPEHPERPTHPKHPFRVPVAALRRELGSAERIERSGVIDGLAAVSVVVPEGAPVTVDVVLSSYPDGLMVAGTVEAPWRGECRRCGGAVEGTVAASVRERFVPEGRTGGDEEAYLFSDDLVDLEPMARDAVLLELPLAPLCSEDCRGLCPQCGTNWNLSGCDCTRPVDPRWSALDRLRER
jgi:DUF177 domain-containing protein